ncbi:MAG: glycosyltransferase [bacterium]
MHEPAITVYIPSHNYGKFLEQAIESVLRQTESDWELLLIDDNSSDNTREIMALYQGDPRIRLFHTNSIGLLGVANLALIESRGKYFVRLDGDDYLDENALMVMKSFLDRHPDSALVFPDFFLVDEQGNVLSLERRERLYENNHMLDVPANGACTMIRTELLREAGGYRIDVDAQDGLDLWLKMCRQHRCSNVNLPLFYYRRHGNNLTETTYRIYDARRYIKTQSIANVVDNYRPIIAVIPCRRLYDFHNDLWNSQINGVSLLDLAIRKNIRSSLFDHIIVASDNEDVIDTMNKFGDPRLVFHRRTTEETVRSRSIADTLSNIANRLDPERRGISLLNYVQAPFKTTQTLEEAVATLILNQSDTAIAVREVKQTVFMRTATGMRAVNPPSALNSDFNAVYIETFTTLATRNHILNRGSLIGASVVNFVAPEQETYFIRTERDLQIARTLYAVEQDLVRKQDLARGIIA